MLRRLVLASSLFAAACGGPGSFNGTVSGNSLTVKDAIFALLKDDTTGKSAGMVLLLLDQTGICDKLKANRNPKNATGMIFALFNLSDQGEPLAPDATDYTMKTDFTTGLSGHIGQGGFSKTDANCTDTLQSKNTEVQSGLVKVTSLNGATNGYANGTFDITVGSQLDKVTGSFNASFCDVTKIQSNPSCE